MPRREKQYSDTKGSVQVVGRVVSGEKERSQKSEGEKNTEKRWHTDDTDATDWHG